MTPPEADLEGVLEEAKNLMTATRYRDALALVGGALERWDATLSPPQRFRLRGICAHCEYFGGEIAAAETALTALIRDREQACAFDLGYLNDIRTLGFVKRALCEFDEAKRFLRAVEAQLERNKHDAYCSQLLEEVKKDIADTLTIEAGERTEADLTVHRIEVEGVFGKRTIAVGPLEIPPSALDLSCRVRVLQLVFNTLHSATLHVEFDLDNTTALPPWGDAGTEALPVLFLLMLPRFGKVHHGRFHLDINGDETIRKQVVLENHRFLIVHPQSYQPHSNHPIPRCRTYRYAEGDCAVFRAPAPPRARIRFEGQVDFARGPDEAGGTTTAELVRSLWILLPYGAVDLPLPSITALSGNINLVSSAVSRAPFYENRTGFSAGTQTFDGGETVAPVVGPAANPHKHGWLKRRIAIGDFDFLLLESMLRPTGPLAVFLELAADVLPLGIVNDLPDTRVWIAAGPDQAATLKLASEPSHQPVAVAKVLVENYSSHAMPIHVSLRADLIGVALDRDLVLPPFHKEYIPLPAGLRPRLDSWRPVEDESHPVEGTPFEVVVRSAPSDTIRLATPVRILPPDYAVWTVSEPSAGNLVDLRLLIARWVTPAAPAIPHLLEEARAVYTGDPVHDLRAVYEHLARMELAYDMSRINHGAEMEYRFQRVRFPSVTLAHRRMNCIDGTVLFASCAESLGHSPAVVFVPEHAFLALLDGPLKAIKRMAFLETTLVCSGRGSYDDALASGMRQFEECRDLLLPEGDRGRYRTTGMNPYRIVPIELARELNVLPGTEWLQ